MVKYLSSRLQSCKLATWLLISILIQRSKVLTPQERRGLVLHGKIITYVYLSYIKDKPKYQSDLCQVSHSTNATAHCGQKSGNNFGFLPANRSNNQHAAAIPCFHATTERDRDSVHWLLGYIGIHLSLLNNICIE